MYVFMYFPNTILFLFSGYFTLVLCDEKENRRKKKLNRECYSLSESIESTCRAGTVNSGLFYPLSDIDFLQPVYKFLCCCSCSFFYDAYWFPQTKRVYVYVILCISCEKWRTENSGLWTNIERLKKWIAVWCCFEWYVSFVERATTIFRKSIPFKLNMFFIKWHAENQYMDGWKTVEMRENDKDR